MHRWPTVTASLLDDAEAAFRAVGLGDAELQMSTPELRARLSAVIAVLSAPTVPGTVTELEELPICFCLDPLAALCPLHGPKDATLPGGL